MKAPQSRAVQSPHVLDCITHSAAQTSRLGRRLGALLRPYDLILLIGEFGSGKTQLAKGIVEGLGSDELVNSPSFVLVNEYRAGPEHGRMPIFHVDLYRLESPAELHGLGLEEISGAGGVALIEWAERAESLLPAERLSVYLSYLSDTKRALRFVPHGQRYEALLAQLKQTAFA